VVAVVPTGASLSATLAPKRKGGPKLVPTEMPPPLGGGTVGTWTPEQTKLKLRCHWCQPDTWHQAASTPLPSVRCCYRTPSSYVR
jgi:hypothetical protein